MRYEQVLLRSGTLAMTGNLDLGGNTLTNIGADLSMSSHKITNLAAPSSANDAARKVDAERSDIPEREDGLDMHGLWNLRPCDATKRAVKHRPPSA